MPLANLKYVREVSSEDGNFLAENLLKLESGKKWKTKSVGEKSAYVIFELGNNTQITGIDIGNEHSAFVEVLVSSSGCRAEDFTEILITCSFMTPIESKNSSNPNRVRCFCQDALVASAACKSWRLLKVICTQPFNRHVQYGLSFIKIHIAETGVSKDDMPSKALVPEKFLVRKSETKTDGGALECSATKPKFFAKFALREDSPDSESESSTALFNRWKKTRNADTEQTAAAAIRRASTPAGLQKLSQGVKQTIPFSHNIQSTSECKESKISDRNREDLIFGKDDQEEQIKNEKLERLSKHIEAEQTRLKIRTEELAKKNKKNEEKPTRIVNTAPELKNHSKIRESPKKSDTKKDICDEKTMHDEEKQHSKFQTQPKVREPPAKANPSEQFNRKRTLSPSKRPAKKNKPLEILEYRPFNQLFRGIVLVMSGIQNPDRANLRSKALAMGAKYKADWEPGCTHLICAFKNTPKYNQVKGKGKIVSRSWIEKCFNLKKYLPWRRYALDAEQQSKDESDNEVLDESLKPANKDSDEEESSLNVESKSFVVDSESDTDDDIQKVLLKNNMQSVKKLINRDVYELTTEEEDFEEL